MERKTNWKAIAAATVACFLVGFLWYGLLFTDTWMAGNGITMEGDKAFKNGVEMSSNPFPMVFNIIAMLVNTLLVNWFMQRMGVHSLGGGIQVGGVIGFIMALGVVTGNLFAASPNSLSFVDGSYSVVIFTAIGAILGGWPQKAA